MKGQTISCCKTFQLKARPWVHQTDSHPLPGAAGCTLLSALEMREALHPRGCATVIRECIPGQLQQEQSLGTLLGIPMISLLGERRVRERSAGELPGGAGGTRKREAEVCKALCECWLSAKLGEGGLPQKAVYSG